MISSRDRLIHWTATAGVVVVVLMLAATTAVIFKPRVTAALGIAPPAVPSAYEAGASIDVPAAWYASAPHTLVIFARESCAACQKAAPFLTQLVKNLDPARLAVTFAAAGPDVPENHRYAESLGVAAASIHQSPRVRARVTPTLVLVTQSGKVVASWEGVGPEGKQQEIAAAIARAR